MNKALGAFLILLVNAIFAFVFSLEQFALVHSYPLFITGLRMLIGGACLFGYLWYADKNAFSFKLKDAKLATSWLIFLLAFFNIYVTNGAEIWGLQYVSGAKAAFISNLAPFASAFFSYFYFNETMNTKKFLGLIIALLGFMPVIITQTACEKNLSHVGFLTSADFALLLATITFVYGWILMQQLIKKGSYDHKAANAVSMLLGSLFCFAHSLLTEPWKPLPVKEGVDWPSLWLLILSMVVLSNIIAYLAYSALLKRYTATFLSFTSFSSYLCAALYDWLFAGLFVPWHVWIGSGIFIIGLYIFYKEEQAQGYT